MLCGPVYKILIFSAWIISISYILSGNAFAADENRPDLPDAAKPREDPVKRIDQRPPPTDKLFLVPPLVHRPLAVDAGERLIVRGFALHGVVDRPEYGLLVKDLETLLENARLEKQQLVGETIEGFTFGALTESAKILRDLVNRREAGEATQEDLAQIKELVQKLKDVEYNQGLTIGQLQEIVDSVTRYYRQNGFILAQAYIPAQTIQNGIVVVQVLEGTLSGLAVEGNSDYSDEDIRDPFQHLIGLPVVKQPLESALLELTDYPGLSAFGVFRPGQDIGSSELVINVQKEKTVDATIRVDNYGSEYTGEYRALLNFSFYNLAGAKDHFFGNLYKTFDPDNGLYGVLNYELPVVSNKNLLGVNISRNEFKMDRTTSSIEAKGDTTIGSLYFRRTLKRSRGSNHYTGVTFARKRSEVEIVGTPTRDDLAVLTLDYQFDALDPRTAGVNLGYIRYSHGFDGILGVPSDDENDQLFKLSADSTAKFDKVELGYTRLQSLNPANSLMVTARGQFTNDILASLEQMSIGGPDSVRAYPVAQYLRDQAYFGSLEWILRAPGASELPVFDNKTLGDVMQLSIYFDIAGGSLNKKDSDDSESVTIKGLGVGLTLNIFSFSTRIDVAKPVDVKSEEEGFGVQTYFNAAYRF